MTLFIHVPISHISIFSDGKVNVFGVAFRRLKLKISSILQNCQEKQKNSEKKW